MAAASPAPRRPDTEKPRTAVGQCGAFRRADRPWIPAGAEPYTRVTLMRTFEQESAWRISAAFSALSTRRPHRSFTAIHWPM